MPETIEHPFCQITPAQAKKNCLNIIESYSHEWDILAELVQNATDAVNARFGEEESNQGLISITLNKQLSSITVSDNGCGIPGESFIQVTSPNSHLTNSQVQVGEKGVGLSFAILMGNKSTIHSCDSSRKSNQIVFNGMRTWLGNGHVDDNPEVPVLEQKARVEQGTEVSIEGVAGDDGGEHPLLSLTYEQLEYVLFTKTYAGNTRHLFDEDFEGPRYQLTLVESDGVSKVGEIQPAGYYGMQKFQKIPSISVKEFNTWSIGKNDETKKRHLKGKVITWSKKIRPGIFAHAWFLPSASFADDWDTLALSASLADVEQLKSNETEAKEWREKYGWLLPKHSVTASISGMPTGIHIGFGGGVGQIAFQPRFFVLIQHNNLKFDMGRKSLNGPQVAALRRYAKEAFTKLLNPIQDYVTGSKLDAAQHFDRANWLTYLDRFSDLNYENTTFIKSPAIQEAGVAAIFFELIGSGKLPGIIPIMTGFNDPIDISAKYIDVETGVVKNELLMIELKADLTGLIKDFKEGVKQYSWVDMVVVWEIKDSDRRAVESGNLRLELADTTNQWHIPPSQHFIRGMAGQQQPINVFSLKEYLDSLQE